MHPNPLDQLQEIADRQEAIKPPEVDRLIDKLQDIDVLEAQRNRIRASVVNSIVESLPDALVVVDEEGKIFLVNMQTEFLFGYHRTELLGNNVEMLIPPKYHAHHVHHRRVYNEQPHVRTMGAGLQLSGLRKNGAEFPVEIMLAPMITTNGLYDLVLVRRLKKTAGEEALRE